MTSDAPVLRATAAAYGLTVLVHVGDHLRRGTDASPRAVVVLGSLAVVVQLAVVAWVLLGRRSAALLAVVVGLPDVVGVFVVHLLPRWSFLSDAFPGAERSPGVTAFSWVTAIAQLLAGAAFAWAGWVALRRARRVFVTAP